VLASEGERLVAALLLGEARYPMFADVINAHPVALPDCEAARDRKAGILQVILRAGRGGAAEFGWPPVNRGLAGSRDEQIDAGVTAALTLRFRMACIWLVE